MRIRLFMALIAALSMMAGTTVAGTRAGAEFIEVSIDIDTLGLQCDGDSAPALLSATSGSSTVADYDVRIAFSEGEGTVRDPATGEEGAVLDGVTDANGEWHVELTPTPGTETRVFVAFGHGGHVTLEWVACPFPDDDSFALRTQSFWDLDGNGRRGAREMNLDGVQIGLAARGCCSFGVQVPPHWSLTRPSGMASWNGLWQNDYQIWHICVPDGADYHIVSVNATPIEHENDCQPLPLLREGRNRAVIGVAPR